MEEAIKRLIKDQIELYKHQPEGSSAKKGEIYNEIERLAINLSCEKTEDYDSLYWTDEDIQLKRAGFVDGFMEAINCFINDKYISYVICTKNVSQLLLVLSGLDSHNTPIHAESSRINASVSHYSRKCYFKVSKFERILK